MKHYLAALLIFIHSFISSAQTINLFKADTTLTGGEVQSCVLAPGLKPNAPNGRVLFSTDEYYWGVKKFIGYYDLGSRQTTLKLANIDLSEAGSDYQFGTNDHDLICMPNGNIIFAVGCFSKKDVSNKPNWWADTYRGNFGPGARSAVMLWRSTDGGENFKLYSIYDPLVNGPAYAALPQMRYAADKSLLHSKPWDMGGSDGQITKMVRGNGNRLYLTFGVFGYYPENDKEYTPGKFISKTLLLFTDDEGKTWKNTDNSFPVSQWRSGIATTRVGNGENRLYCSSWSGLYMSKKSSDGNQYSFDNTLLQPDNFGASWATIDGSGDASAELKKHIGVNIWSHPVLGNCPGSNKLVACWPVAVNNKKGLQVFLFDPEKNQFNELAAIEPVNNKPGNNGSAVFHPVMVQDRADAPLLIYWYNLDQSDTSYKIRGRLIFNDKKYSQDFDITASMTLTTASKLWFGDYHTAGCFSIAGSGPVRTSDDNKEIAVSTNKQLLTTSFYPVWVDTNKKILFSRVKVNTYVQNLPSINDITKVLLQVNESNWKNPTGLNKIKVHPNWSERNFKVEEKKIPRPGTNLKQSLINIQQ